MADNNTHIIYTAEHIEQYFSGKLSPQEMHAMEKAALDDPFLADAMEGYEEMKGKPWQAQLTAAKAQIAAKENEQKATPIVVSFKWWKAVAAVLIVGGGVGLAYFFERSSPVNKENTTIAALTKDSATQADTSNMAVVPPAIKADSATRVVVIKDEHAPLIAQVKPQAPSASKPVLETEQQAAEKEPSATVADEKKEEADKESIAAAPVAAAPGNDDINKARTEGFNNSTLANRAKSVYKAPALNNRFSATVTGPDNTPLAYANVLVIDENIGTYADAKGKFRLAAADSILNVRVRAAGYMPQVYPIKSGLTDNRIVLSEQQVAANEVVQLKNKKSTGVLPKITVHLDSVMNVEPEDGWYNYDTYLSNNISPAIDKNIHGEVEVIFDVQKDGSISNVSIAKSLCAACDQEALRVIKEGPQWKVKKGKTDKGKVKVKF